MRAKTKKTIASLTLILLISNIICYSTSIASGITENNTNNTNIQLKTQEIQNELKITTEFIYNEETNTVIGKVKSNNPLKDTKTSWKLSEDKLTYTNENFTENGSYYTIFEDIYGQTANVLIDIKGIKPKLEITTEFIYNEKTNTVTGKIHSTNPLKDTKTSWKLSEDKLTYVNENFTENGSYYTIFEDIYGQTKNVLIEITQIKHELKITTEFIYNDATNTVTGKIHSNNPLKDTKTSWKLSEDKLTYVNENFTENGSYYTTFEDIYGNKSQVLIKITGIKEPLKLTKEFIYNKSTNKVTGKIHSNNPLKDTKKSWKLSEDRLTYTNENLTGNGSYYTTFEDIYGQTAKVLIEITQIDDKAPEITVEYVTNSDGTITAIMHSNEPLGETKPSWTLSKDKLTYSKVFSESTNYTTPVEDIYGNSVDVKIVIRINTGIKDYTTLNEEKYPGFKALLQKLKNAHPNWNIKVYYTNIDWENFINEEDKIIYGSPRSLTQYPYLNEWSKGSEKYDVSQNWYRATKSAIRYMTDPRNSMDEAWFFQFQDVSASSGTKEEVKKMVNGTFLDNDSVVNAILNAAREEGISPFHIVSRVIQEQGANGKGIMNGYQYLGKTVYNLFNINVTNKISGITEGAKYAYERGWFTPEASIKGGAGFLTTKYIDKGQSTLYFQKYNVINTKNLYGNQYMQNIRAANDEGNRMYKTYKENGMLDSHFEFVVPVYENMPKTVCPRPKDSRQ